jgi:excisionase family DNA binding protein
MAGGRKPPSFAPVNPPPAELPAREVYGDGVLTVRQAAAFLGVSVRYVHDLILRGEVRAIKLGKNRQVPRRLLVEMLVRLDESQRKGA